MKNIFSMNGSVFAFMTTIYQVIVVNVLFLISSIPIITIGASLTAMYSCCLKIANGDEVFLWADYKRAFKNNFKISTQIYGITVVVFASVFGLAFAFQRLNFTVGLWIVLGLATVLIFGTEYLYPLIARFENTWSEYLRNAVVLSIHNAAISIAVFIVTVALLVFFPVFIPKLFFLWLFTAFGATGLINSYMFKYVFNKYEASAKE
ncbi:YesL family protein [Lapidilactobacillus bayanensis]|uniref:YesL family protein n=1 Tax=Lapidilactobacillus bayanensis TaxID=2485998 RepID=UPI000F7B9FC7|nr:YesL family protein [Lapidilactobacillus bayanensis]